MNLSDLTRFAVANQQLLKQLQDALLNVSEINSLFYSSSVPIVGGASMGAHLRHILDFYSAFYLGAKKGKVNYDDRARNTQIENSLSAGLDQLEIAVEQLEEVAYLTNRSIEIFASIDVAESENYKTSCLARELQTLHSHTTHHMAIIAIILKLNDIDVSSDFGKAPSTIQYEYQLSSQTQNNTTLNMTN